MTSTSSRMAWLTAVPMAPEELSTCSSAGETFSSKRTAPSAARRGSLRAVFLISETASFTRWMAGWDLQPNELRRKRGAKAHLCFIGRAISVCSLGSGAAQ